MGKPYRLVDAAGIDKPMPQAAGHRLLHFPGGDAQPGGSVGLTVSNQRSVDIVPISPPFFGRMGRRHAIAVAVKEHAGEQARLASACTGVALGGVGGEPRLDRIPQRLIDDRCVFAGMGLSLVDDLTAIEAVLQHQVERAAREWLTSDAATRSARPRLASDPPSFELVLQ